MIYPLLIRNFMTPVPPHVSCVCFVSQFQQTGSQQRLLVTRAPKVNCFARVIPFSHDLLIFSPFPPPACRVFAVGYASRQLGSGSQLELLLSNPPATPGAAIHPADWLAVAPSKVTCQHCDREGSAYRVRAEECV
jgi:hypothetical protein